MITIINYIVGGICGLVGFFGLMFILTILFERPGKCPSCGGWQ